MRLLFYQPNYTGHFFAYLARMLPGFTDLPVEIVVATTRRALESEEYRRTLAPFAERVRFEPCCTPLPAGRRLLRSQHRLKELRKSIDALAPDHVAVCFADGLAETAAVSTMLGRRPWPQDLVVEGWIYRGSFGDPADRRPVSIARRWFYRQLLAQGLFRRLHIDHELLFAFVESISAGSRTDVVLTPNPIVFSEMIDKAEARRRLGIATDGLWLTLSGLIEKYKGVHLLLDAYRQYRVASPAQRARLLLAGPHEPAIRAMLADGAYASLVADGSIVSCDRFLDESEMFAAAAAADLVVAPYPNHTGRSSIILWAAAAGRPSLGAGDGCIGHVIRNEALGATCDVQDTAALAVAIAQALERPWTDDDVQRVRRYAEWHRVENYQQIASQLVRERLAGTANGDSNDNPR